MNIHNNAFRRYGVEVYIKTPLLGDDDDTGGGETTAASTKSRKNNVIVDTRGLRLSVLPFFFKNRVDFHQLASPKITVTAASVDGARKLSSSSTFVIGEDAGIPKPLNQTIFDILSRAEYLSSLQHENLAQFIAAEPSQKHHDQILIVSEDYSNSLQSIIEQNKSKNQYIESVELGKLCYQILKGLCYLHQNRITHRNLSIENIKLDNQNQLKLTNYGLYHLTNQGEDVAFPIGNLCNLSPESILKDMRGSSNPKCDVWALGCLLLESISNRCLWNDRDPTTVMNRILYLAGIETSTQQYDMVTNLFKSIPKNNQQNNIIENSKMKEYLKSIKESKIGNLYQLEEGLYEIIENCLIPRVEDRPTASSLLDHPYFNHYKSIDPFSEQWVERPLVKSLELPDDLSVLTEAMDRESEKKEFDRFCASEIYHLWKLTGGDLEKELVSQNLTNPSPSVHKLPLYVPLLSITSTPINSNQNTPTLQSNNNNQNNNNNIDITTTKQLNNNSQEEEEEEKEKEEQQNIIHSRTTSVLYNNEPCLINIDHLIPKFKSAYLNRDKLLEEELNATGEGYIFTNNNIKKKRKKETNDLYQIIRLKEFHHLLYRYQYEDPIHSQPLIIRMAQFGIPSILRGDIWAAILGVNDAETSAIFSSINLDVKGPNDKQFELDIPRCHQYHPLLSSKRGHSQLFRVLKGWTLLNMDKGCYWQGMDNVASPFVAHNYQNEARSFGCLKAFVDKYLKILYVPNNFQALNEMMMIYQQLLAYHDPELAIHLHDVQLEPNLYAIPWFITVFAHLLPIDKIDPLWDTILLGPSSLPYFVAVSIMTQFRTLLLKSNLENCIRALARIPAVDIDQCVSDALSRFNNTPLSTTIQKHVSGADGELWWMQEVPLEIRKKELFPRINIHDLINMQQDRVRILDIRSQQQYNLVHYPHSICINFTHAMSSQSNKSKLHQQLDQHRGISIVVISSHSQLDEVVEFCNLLVKWKFPYVSLLNGGMDALEHGAQTLLITQESKS